MINYTYGRIKILTDMIPNGNIEHDKKIIPLIIENSLPYHNVNVEKFIRNKQWYYNDTGAILTKIKHIRPEIDNKFTFSIPRSVVKMNNGYCFGAPFKYVCNEAELDKQEQVQAFNKCLNAVNNHKHTLACTRNAGIYGISYKLALRPTEKELAEGKFFNVVSDIDNMNTFKVYSNTIQKDEVLGVIFYDRKKVDEQTGIESTLTERVFNVWTKYHQWTFIKDNNGIYSNQIFPILIGGEIINVEAFPLRINTEAVAEETLIPLQEYERSDDRVGDFELSIRLMDAINTLACCRLDSVQQSSDYIIKLRDIDVGEFDENGYNPVLDRIKKYMQQHFLAVESRDGADVQPDIDILDIPLNQSQVQELQDFLWEMLLQELQQPTRSGGTGQDTGVAVENRNGFRELENNAVTITEFTINAEKEFVSKLLQIGQMYPNCPFKDLTISDISIQTMRNRSENTTTSTTNYREMRNAGVNPYTAYTTSGLVADVNDTVKLDEMWKQKEQDFILEQELKKEKALKDLEKQYNANNNQESVDNLETNDNNNK